ncbi:MAG: hypothetical protein HDQ89_02360 [Desulfovibrio sp.]|nr:hypothetical protein [Desulfovibrio sp.]
MRQPNLKEFTKEEEDRIIQEAMTLYDIGKNKEGDDLLDTLPMHAEYLQTLKECEGLQVLIDKGINLSLAVKKFGPNWLTS